MKFSVSNVTKYFIFYFVIVFIIYMKYRIKNVTKYFIFYFVIVFIT